MCFLSFFGFSITDTAWASKTNFNQIQLDGDTETVDSTSVTVLLRNPSGYVLLATGATVPSDAEAGYAKGCLFIQTDGEANTTLYLNEGSETSADFNVGTASTTFTSLTDTPGSLVAKTVYGVNAGATALEAKFTVGTMTPTSGNVLVADGTDWGTSTPDSAGLVSKTGTQTIAGVKTFSNNPVFPAGSVLSTYLQNAAADLGAADVTLNFSNSNGSYVTNLITDGDFTANKFNGNVTGNVTGNVSGSSGSCTGNAVTVTNGVYTTDTGSISTAMIAANAVNATKLQNAAADLGNADIEVDFSNSNEGNVTNITTDGSMAATAGFIGALTGNADTVTNGVYTTDTGSVSTAMIAANAVNATKLQAAAADLGAADVTVNLGNTNGAFNTNITTDGSVTATDGFTGDLTGNASGSSGSCTGNAASVTNGVYTTDTGTVTPVMMQNTAADLGAANVTVDLGNTNGSFVTNLTIDGTSAASAFSGATGTYTTKVTTPILSQTKMYHESEFMETAAALASTVLSKLYWTGGGTNGTQAVIAGANGILQMDTTATGSSTSALIFTTANFATNNAPVFEAYIKTDLLTNRKVNVGWYVDTNDYIMFEFNTATDAANIYLSTKNNGGAEVSEDTTVDLVADTYIKLRIEINANESFAAYINDVRVNATHAGTIRELATFKPYFYIDNKDQAQSNTMNIDYIKLWQNR